MKFTDLPLSLQLKITSGKPWVLDDHERAPMYKYLDHLRATAKPSDHPMDLTRNMALFPPARFLPGGPVHALGGTFHRAREVAIQMIWTEHDPVWMPTGPSNAPSTWDNMRTCLGLGPNLVRGIRKAAGH